MNISLRVALNTSVEQKARLLALQVAFAQVCNALAPTVQQTRVWNRVALHQLMYRSLRERFPELGSQMVCNAIYSVSRTSRLLFQNPASPFSIARLGNKPLPLFRYADTCPVYFDRHTLSVKDGQLSMYTLDGRMRFDLALTPQDEANFRQKKLREVVLAMRSDGVYELSFQLSTLDEGMDGGGGEEGENAPSLSLSVPDKSEIPEYVMVEEAL